MTDTTALVEEYVNNTPSIAYTAFTTEWIEKGYTVIYEWCSPKSRIVLEYNDDSLRLISLRHMQSGSYISYSEMANIAKAASIPVSFQTKPALTPDCQRVG